VRASTNPARLQAAMLSFKISNTTGNPTAKKMAGQRLEIVCWRSVFMTGSMFRISIVSMDDFPRLDGRFAFSFDFMRRPEIELIANSITDL